MVDTLTNKIVEAVKSVVRPLCPEGYVQLHRPFIGTQDVENVAKCVSNEPVGYGYIESFEEALERECGVKHAIAVSSGTAALHLALLAAGAGPGRMVGMPSLTFAAGAAAICYTGAEIGFGNPHTEIGITVDLLGEPSTAPVEHHVIIEDAAEALGSTVAGRACGSFGHMGVLSFNNNKIITTGGGGAVLTDDEDYAHRVRHLATTARLVSRPIFFEHSEVGYNYRMPNVCAALGLGQLERLSTILDYKHKLRRAYADAFHAMQPSEMFFKFGKPRSNAWLNAIWVPGRLRDEIIQALYEAQIIARPLFTPLHLQTPYHRFTVTRAEANRSEEEFRTTILLPSGRLEA